MTERPSVAFRTTGGVASGLGHVSRCLALAQALRALEVESLFLLDGDGTIRDRVAAAGFPAAGVRAAHDLADTVRECRAWRPHAVIVDSYATGPAYFRGLAGTWPLVVLDDLADRELPVDLIVNGSAGADRLAYRGAPHTRYLLGPRFVPLRPDFAEPPARVTRAEVRRVLVTVGGSDPTGFTAQLVRWTAKALGDVTQDVVVGPFVRGAERRSGEAALGPVVLHEDPPDMRRLMLEADLAVSGGGQTIYELAASATPAIAIRMAQNQTGNLTALSEAGALQWVGAAGDAALESHLSDALVALAAAPHRREAMGRRGRALVDGKGAARAARAVMELAGARE